jgi:hypothetical protein
MRKAGSVAELARRASERGLITPETLRSLAGITLLRNLAAHSGPGFVTPERAAEYLAIADMLMFVLAEPSRPATSRPMLKP